MHLLAVENNGLTIPPTNVLSAISKAYLVTVALVCFRLKSEASISSCASVGPIKRTLTYELTVDQLGAWLGNDSSTSGAGGASIIDPPFR